MCISVFLAMLVVLRKAMLVCRSTTLVRTEIPQHSLDGSAQYFVQSSIDVFCSTDFTDPPIFPLAPP